MEALHNVEAALELAGDSPEITEAAEELSEKIDGLNESFDKAAAELEATTPELTEAEAELEATAPAESEIQAATFPSDVNPVDILMSMVIQCRQFAGQMEPSRELSLVITKIDEAGLWLSTLLEAPFEELAEDPPEADGSAIWTPELAVVGDPGTGQPEQPENATEGGSE